MKTTRRILFAFVAALAIASAARADDLVDMRRACLDRGNFHKGIHWFEECIQELFSADPVHIAVTFVSPGAGTAAFGLGFAEVPRIRAYEFLINGVAAVSTDGSYITQLQATLALPGHGIRLEDWQRTLVQKYGLQALARPNLHDPVDAKTAITLRWRRIDAREQDFYGLGPDSTLAARASYGLILNETYAGISDPFTQWNTFGFDFSFLQPRVTSSINDVPEIQSAYSEATAPGLTIRDDFIRFGPNITVRIPARRSYFTALNASYSVYDALGDPLHSFQRLSAVSRTEIPLWLPSHHTPSHRNAFKNTVCPSLRSDTRCSVGTLDFIASTSVSYKSADSQVPFYFDPTLGGTNMAGDDTLRGFTDFRFRAPNDVLFQLEYRHPIYGPLGLLGFYDTGKVALIPSELGFTQLRHDIGLGIYLQASNHEIVRFYIGFGTGEPLQSRIKFPAP